MDLRKRIVAQTYAGAMNMQGHLTVVYEMICENFAQFAISIHWVNHIVQLSIREMNNNEYNILTRVTSNCFAVVKMIKYSPKRKAMLDRVKRTIDSCLRADDKAAKNVYA